MMSKIKSSKIARVKLIAGLVLAAALIVVFSLENKAKASVNELDGLKAEQPETSLEHVRTDSHKMANDSLEIKVDGKTLNVIGNKETLHKFSTMIGDKTKYTAVRNLATGDMDLITENASNASKTFKSPETVDGDHVFFKVEEMPEFPGGEQGLRTFLANTIKYPEEAQKAKTQGKVFVTFVVDKNGKVRNAKIARGVDPGLDAEALRVVSALPDWKPGKQKGEPVDVSYTVPINFALE